MADEWLLVETLGAQPAVVAQGDRLKNLVPLSAFLRRNPHLAAITAAINGCVSTATAQTHRAPKNDRVIRTEPVQMSDGRVHGVHLWFGPDDLAPPQRSVPGPLIWNLTTGAATDTPQSLANSGMDPATENTHGRTFAEDLPTQDLNLSETKVLSLAVKSYPGATFCSTWDVTDRAGELITVGFVARAALETTEDGSECLLARAMNWRSHRDNTTVAPEHLAQRILAGLARPGVYRALLDFRTWTLLRWLDEPCPLYDWRGRGGAPWVHPGDAKVLEAMTAELESGMTERVLLLPGHAGDWVPMHVTVHRVELEPGAFVGLITLRSPTAAELRNR